MTVDLSNTFSSVPACLNDTNEVTQERGVDNNEDNDDDIIPMPDLVKEDDLSIN